MAPSTGLETQESADKNSSIEGMTYMAPTTQDTQRNYAQEQTFRNGEGFLSASESQEPAI